jgi:endoglycosylceramidase
MNSFEWCSSYEIINEPWAGNYLVNPALVLPGIAGATNLQPFYEKIARAIRAVDNDTLIFYEPVTWGGMFDHNRFDLLGRIFIR